MKSFGWSPFIAIALLISHSGAVIAHDPIFGIGPHVLFKNGIETAIEVVREMSGEETENELGLEITYGITGDWAVGIEIPYVFKDDGTNSSRGISDGQAFTKYRFWREDSLGLQKSAAVMLAVNGKNGDEKTSPPLGNGATDMITGLTYGYEGLKWYRWASARIVLPGKNTAGFQKGNKWLVDLAGGWRPTPPEYKKPDTVWLLELNGEIANKAKLNGKTLSSSGGTEWFISPGIFWTTRNFAIKSGFQIPIASDLNGTQDKSDYRFKATFEWHL